MATVAEIVGARPGEIPQITVPFLSLSGVALKRMYTGDSLCNARLEGELSPNSVASLELLNPSKTKASTELRLIAAAGGYTTFIHLMAMYWGEKYTPGSEDVSDHEGEAEMFIQGNIASGMLEDPETRIIVRGNNWSPRSFMQKGFQSIPTKVHSSIFNLPDFSVADYRDRHIKMVDEETLDIGSKLAIKGTYYNQQAGRLLLHALQDEAIGDSAVMRDLLDIDKTIVDYRGLRVPTTKPIDDLLRTTGVFKGLIRPLSVFMGALSTNLSMAFTDLDPLAIDNKIAEALRREYFSEEDRIKDTDALLAYLTRIPSFLPREERLKKITGLACNYTGKFIDYLTCVNSRMPDSGPAFDWKIGGAHMISLHYDKKTDEGFLAVFSTMVDGPGGIVEATEGMLLQRPPEPFSSEEAAIRRAAYKQHIQSALDMRNGYHKFARVKAVYV